MSGSAPSTVDLSALVTTAQQTNVILTKILGQLSNIIALSSSGGPVGAATAVAGAATLNVRAGVVTSEALTGATTYTLTIMDSFIDLSSVVMVNATDSAALAITLNSVAVSAGQVIVVVSMAALTGTVRIAFQVSG